jgi:galactose-1-phosphate uridylyltransferase
MPIEYRKEQGSLVWVRNPFTGHVTYFTHVHKKRSGFARRASAAPPAVSPPDRGTYEAKLRAELEAAQRSCPFCPGNEDQTPEEVVRVTPQHVFPGHGGSGWLIRAVPNLIPRIPECCTGGRNESYVVIEDPRHFADDAQGHEDLLYSALLPLEQFQALLAADVEVTRRAHANPAVHGVLIRKNQGRESGASQPHVHNQVIGADMPFATVAQECARTRDVPQVWQEVVAFARQHGFVLDERDGCCAYFCPFGTFPRSYDIVCLEDWVRMIDLPAARWRIFGTLLHRVLNLLGPIPLDYEIHEGPGLPLHAHVNARHFTYSNIGGTLNLPSNLTPTVPVGVAGA